MRKAGVEQLGRALRVELAQHGASASVAYFGFIDTEMVHRRIDADPLADRMLASSEGPLHKRLPRRAAGEAIARGIERAPRGSSVPRRWAALSVAARRPQSARRRAAWGATPRSRRWSRELERRAGEEQPTTL